MGSEQSLNKITPRSKIKKDFQKEISNCNVNFMINGKQYSPKFEEVSADSRLVDFIRDNAGLKGTKYMCREGGCGSCTITAKLPPAQNGEKIISVNSCLVPILSCDGWQIHTVENLGSYKAGYHEIQKRLINSGGSQCGYCTSGMVMNMYSLLESEKGKLAERDIEDAYDGNICRCTGYRPILDAFKSFANDTSEELKRKCCINENVNSCNKNTKTNEFCKMTSIENLPICVSLKSGEEWIRPNTIDQFFEAISHFKATGINYRLVAGNTGTGVFKKDGPFMAFVDITRISELQNLTKIEPSNVTIGAGQTLKETIEILRKASEIEGYEYAGQLSTHIKRVSNTSIRNVGTMAGNLMLKYEHRAFPSDFYTILEGVGVKIKIASAPNLSEDYFPKDFLSLQSMNGKIIISFELQKLPKKDGYILETYKISKRYQNSHAFINAAHLIKIDPETNQVLENPSLVYGGVGENFDHATAAENFLNGKSLLEQSTIDGVMNELETEVIPDEGFLLSSPIYRKKLTQSLLYKTILKILGDKVSPKNQTGALKLERLVTKGQQTFDTDKEQWPINQAVNKIEGLDQASGQAEYVNDIVHQNGELYGAFVLSTTGNAEIENIDPSQALMLPGVVHFISAKDIPEGGINDTEGGIGGPVHYSEIEEIFSTGKIYHASQPIGLILAENREIAYKAIELVKISYKNQGKVSITFPPELLEQNSDSYLKINEDEHKISGQFHTFDQYHYHLETQACLCVPKENGRYDLFPTSQWMDHTQQVVAKALNITNNRVNVSVRRCGGGYGAKIIKIAKVATAAALGAYVSNQPVRIVLTLEENMKMMGKRPEQLMKYETTFDSTGKIIENVLKIICNAGSNQNQTTADYTTKFLQSCYKADHWKIETETILSNLPSCTVLRGPGSTEAIALVENIMENIAKVLNKDANEVRAANYLQLGDPIRFDFLNKNPDQIVGVERIPRLQPYKRGLSNEKKTLEEENPIPKMLEELLASSDYEERKKFADNFNENNRWRKKGLSFVPLRYPLFYGFPYFQTMVSVYNQDGTVTAIHNGIEIGQGINTKVAQAIAKTLSISMEKILINPTNNVVCPNSPLTGASFSSELACYSAIQACKIILQRLEPIKKALGEGALWEEIVLEAHKANIDLNVSYRNKNTDEEEFNEYDIYGIGLSEVEIDILTGEYKIVRFDYINDTGLSMSPQIDIGQIEGCLVMGFGMFLTEKLIYHPETGELLSNNTWEYKVPTPRDIPEDLRIILLKNKPNPIGILGSKSAGEPPLNSSVSVLFALRNALYSSRKDANEEGYFQIHACSTPEEVFLHSLTDKSQFTI